MLRALLCLCLFPVVFPAGADNANSMSNAVFSGTMFRQLDNRDNR